MNGSCGPKQDGQTCPASSECQHEPLRRRDLLRSGLRGRVPQLRAGRHARALHADRRRHRRPARRVRGDGAVDLLDQRQVRRQRRLPELAGRHAVRGRDAATRPATSTSGRRPATPAASACAPDLIPCSPYICNGGALLQRLHQQQPVRDTVHLRRQQLRAQGERRLVLGGRRVPQHVLRAGRLLRQRLQHARASRAPPAQPGVCSNVATGSPDPAGICADRRSVDLRHQRQVRGGRLPAVRVGHALHARDLSRRTTNLFTPLSACDGAGACVTPSPMPCFPYRCGAAACKPSCTADADCQPPAVCTGGFCGLKAPGAICANKNECLSGFCEQGVCCQTACTGICKSCALTASAGVCSNIAAGTVDVLSRCSDQGAPSCGTDGFCDGSGACRLYGASTPCAQPSCPAGQSTQTNGRTCNGLGVCQTATTLACSPYVCDGATACRGTCTERRRLPGAEHLRSEDQPLRQQEAPRPALRGDQRVPDRQLLHQRRLLQHQRVRAVPGVQRRHQRGQLRQRPGRYRRSR